MRWLDKKNAFMWKMKSTTIKYISLSPSRPSLLTLLLNCRGKKYKRNSFKPPVSLWNIALCQLFFGQLYFFALAFNPPHWKPHYLFENWVVIHGMEDRLMHLWCGQTCMLFLSHMFFLWLLRSSKIRLMANLDSQAAIMNKLNVNWTPPPPF